MKREVAISLINVKKSYFVHHDKPTLSERILSGKSELFDALNNVNLTIYKGETVGLVGPNGSGKTTLLKLITGIATPTSGQVITQGKIVSLIDLEAGFHPDLSGIKNIYLNGMVLGMSKKEIDKKLTSIIKFADIGKFIDTALFTYSSGMKLRLGFSVAIHSDPDILIMDENFGVGDVNFQKKVLKKIKLLLSKKITVLVASHSQELIELLTKRVITLKRGKVAK